MDGAERDDRELRRIIALLVGFAAKAECVAGRSFFLRWFLLVILRQACSVARTYVAEATGTEWPGFDDPSSSATSPADAACLAEHFRALAAMLSLLLPSAGRFGRRYASVDRAPWRPAARGRFLLPRQGQPVPGYCDTS